MLPRTQVETSQEGGQGGQEGPGLSYASQRGREVAGSGESAPEPAIISTSDQGVSMRSVWEQKKNG